VGDYGCFSSLTSLSSLHFKARNYEFSRPDDAWALPDAPALARLSVLTGLRHLAAWTLHLPRQHAFLSELTALTSLEGPWVVADLPRLPSLARLVAEDLAPGALHHLASATPQLTCLAVQSDQVEFGDSDFGGEAVLPQLRRLRLQHYTAPCWGCGDLLQRPMRSCVAAAAPRMFPRLGAEDRERFVRAFQAAG
jgi:hypothetical protein